jgi:hypothetical protein
MIDPPAGARKRTETTMDLVHALLGLFAVVLILGAAAAGAWLLVVTPLHGPGTAEPENRDTGDVRHPPRRSTSQATR